MRSRAEPTAVDGAPPDICGYEWPTDCPSFDYDDYRLLQSGASHGQTTCVRASAPDANRCVWHAAPAETSHTEPPHTTEHGTVDGAVLAGVDGDDRLDLRGASLRDADCSEATLENVDCAGATLRSADFTGATLVDVNLAGAGLEDASFSQATFANVDCSEAELVAADFSEAMVGAAHETNDTSLTVSGGTLTGANLQHADLAGVDFADATLTQAQLFETTLAGATLRGADLSQATFGESRLYPDAAVDYPEPDPQTVDLAGADLREATLTAANLRRANLSDARLKNADCSLVELPQADLTSANLEDTDLSRANLRGATLTETVFGATDLAGADLSASDLSGVTFHGVDLAGVNLSEADLSETTLWQADLAGVDFHETNLSDALIKHCDLSQARLHGCKLSNADVQDTDCSGATFSEATLCGTRFARTNLSGATVAGVTVDGETTVESPVNPPPRNTPSDSDTAANNANVYDRLEQQLREAGHHTTARQLQFRVAHARRGEVAEETGQYSLRHLWAVLVELFTGYGVGLRPLVGTSVSLLSLSTVSYVYAGVDDPLWYSVVTFAAVPPGSLASLPVWTQVVAGVETLGGTLLLGAFVFALVTRGRP